ncbi:CheY-like chemotaxis protein [Catenuloplanes atrovinosus]|uniref:CheY-like chemotaxis protein n=1 Tax=Catenuloplanes atrovinosus TaxID=137266 RepID=A0AAE4CFL6_9ACTN|nr:fused response regulator/phosphatase [Catenuloplanes atrovinosus]MDR7279765.1 CheY-like chemotaxis protein [Catenuloplanes atrovinosus]
MHVDPATVLVVDDNATKRYLLVSWLSRAGYAVVEAETGADALQLVEVKPIDLVVLDVRLPDMSGFEVCERIKSNPRHSALPVVHVSAHAVDVTDRAHGLNRGADAYLVEPIEPEELVATTQAVLRYYRARKQAELLAHRMALLAETTLAINSAANFPALLEAAAWGAAKIFKGPAAVVTGTTDGELWAATCEDPEQTPMLRPWSPATGQEIAVGTSFRIDPPETWSLMAWPEGDPVGVAVTRIRPDRPAVHVAVPAAANIPGAPVLRQLAQAIAAAVEAQRSYDEEHRIAITLQRSLLPRRLPEVTGLDIARRYEPASAHTEIGGDFYEVTMIDGRLLAAIGDVAGHSLHAATVMAELRHALRAYAVEGHQPGTVLTRINDLMLTLLSGEVATVCLLLIDPASGHVRMANAGHLPPLLIVDGRPEYIEDRGPLLGTRANRPDDTEFVVPPGATLVLYTDGLIERRDATIDDGLRALAASAAGGVDDHLDDFCDRLLSELAGQEMSDDIAVVALRRH